MVEFVWNFPISYVLYMGAEPLGINLFKVKFASLFLFLTDLN